MNKLRWAPILGPPLRFFDYAPIFHVMIPASTRALLPLFQGPTCGGGGEDRAAANSGSIPSARDSFAVLNMLAFSTALSSVFLDEKPRAARFLRLFASMCMCSAFLLLSNAVYDKKI